MNFVEIEAIRVEAGLSPYRMCQSAMVPTGTYFRFRAGSRKPRPATIDRWLSVLVGGPNARQLSGQPVTDALVAGVYRGFLAAYAQAVGASPEAVLASDPRLRANGDPAWGEAARLRALAVYSTSIEFDLRGARLAAAIGLTRQAVSLILRRVEDMRDDPDIDALIERAGRMLSGRQE